MEEKKRFEPPQWAQYLIIGITIALMILWFWAMTRPNYDTSSNYSE